MDKDLNIRRWILLNVRFRPKIARGGHKSVVFEPYCPYCKTTIKNIGQKRCPICEINLSWNFVDINNYFSKKKNEPIQKSFGTKFDYDQIFIDDVLEMEKKGK